MHTVRAAWSCACVLLLAGCPDFDKFNQPPAQSSDGAASLWATARFGGDTFFAAWSSGGSDLLLVGGTGELLRSGDGGDTFASVSTGTDFDLHGVWGTAPAEAWVAGVGGFLGHYTGDGPGTVDVTLDGAPTLNGVWGAAANDYLGALFSFDGNTWNAVDGGTRADLLAVAGAGGERWATSAAGEILHSTDGGGTWTKQAVASGPLRGLFAASATDVWAVGDGAAWHATDGATWTSEPVAGSLYGVWAGGGEVFAVGADGAIFHRHDGAWAAEPTATDATLRAVWAAMPAAAWAAGATGTIVHRR